MIDQQQLEEHILFYAAIFSCLSQFSWQLYISWGSYITFNPAFYLIRANLPMKILLALKTHFVIMLSLIFCKRKKLIWVCYKVFVEEVLNIIYIKICFLFKQHLLERSQDGRGVGGGGVHLSPHVHHEYLYKWNNSNRALTEHQHRTSDT